MEALSHGKLPGNNEDKKASFTPPAVFSEHRRGVFENRKEASATGDAMLSFRFPRSRGTASGTPTDSPTYAQEGFLVCAIEESTGRTKEAEEVWGAQEFDHAEEEFRQGEESREDRQGCGGARVQADRVLDSETRSSEPNASASRPVEDETPRRSAGEDSDEEEAPRPPPLCLSSVATCAAVPPSPGILRPWLHSAYPPCSRAVSSRDIVPPYQLLPLRGKPRGGDVHRGRASPLFDETLSRPLGLSSGDRLAETRRRESAGAEPLPNNEFLVNRSSMRSAGQRHLEGRRKRDGDRSGDTASRETKARGVEREHAGSGLPDARAGGYGEDAECRETKTRPSGVCDLGRDPGRVLSSSRCCADPAVVAARGLPANGKEEETLVVSPWSEQLGEPSLSPPKPCLSSLPRSCSSPSFSGSPSVVQPQTSTPLPGRRGRHSKTVCFSETTIAGSVAPFSLVARQREERRRRDAQLAKVLFRWIGPSAGSPEGLEDDKEKYMFPSVFFPRARRQSGLASPPLALIKRQQIVSAFYAQKDRRAARRWRSLSTDKQRSGRTARGQSAGAARGQEERKTLNEAEMSLLEPQVLLTSEDLSVLPGLWGWPWYHAIYGGLGQGQAAQHELMQLRDQRRNLSREVQKIVPALTEWRETVEAERDSLVSLERTREVLEARTREKLALIEEEIDSEKRRATHLKALLQEAREENESLHALLPEREGRIRQLQDALRDRAWEWTESEERLLGEKQDLELKLREQEERLRVQDARTKEQTALISALSEQADGRRGTPLGKRLFDFQANRAADKREPETAHGVFSAATHRERRSSSHRQEMDSIEKLRELYVKAEDKSRHRSRLSERRTVTLASPVGTRAASAFEEKKCVKAKPEVSARARSREVDRLEQKAQAHPDDETLSDIMRRKVKQTLMTRIDRQSRDLAELLHDPLLDRSVSLSQLEAPSRPTSPAAAAAARRAAAWLGGPEESPEGTGVGRLISAAYLNSYKHAKERLPRLVPDLPEDVLKTPKYAFGDFSRRTSDRVGPGRRLLSPRAPQAVVRPQMADQDVRTVPSTLFVGRGEQREKGEGRAGVVDWDAHRDVGKMKDRELTREEIIQRAFGKAAMPHQFSAARSTPPSRGRAETGEQSPEAQSARGRHRDQGDGDTEKLTELQQMRRAKAEALLLHLKLGVAATQADLEALKSTVKKQKDALSERHRAYLLAR
ncbi:putative 200 kDa antigen p200 [Toxoplasma gondii p89]|uniref:Putative 200 kDa antigen p200 n=2 Tax=Toxoplasma gondii TaxID=5811 RepID=A0A086J858_TOXGO|nr:putative 200 kDa antigen p200 [Toxoplasma gondii p89]